MREIKVRGKRADNGEWVYGDIAHHYENQRVFILCDQLAFTYTECGINRFVSERFYEVIPETVCQFTGLYDKNGKEIYEGDIVKDADTGKIFEIIYQGHMFLRYERKPMYMFYTLDGDCIEVIGNTYDNPEMVKP